LGNDYLINSNTPQDPAQLDGSRLKLRLPPPPRWRASRPAEVATHPHGKGVLLGSPVPDAGFALRLYRAIEPSVIGTQGIDPLDLRAAIQATALARASQLGRAPVRADIEWAVAYWGFGLKGQFDVSDRPPSGIHPAERNDLFSGCAHDVLKQRKIASLIDHSLVASSPSEIVSLGSGRR